ncbi:hypothetical protein [Maricaulis sp. MIT060901]|uniref:hypothetical protein n=1 Tax=Maricaulis sp. MIT060901 TaxID=3096993 RepID=UPI0039998CEF
MLLRAIASYCLAKLGGNKFVQHPATGALPTIQTLIKTLNCTPDKRSKVKSAARITNKLVYHCPIIHTVRSFNDSEMLQDLPDIGSPPLEGDLIMRLIYERTSLCRPFRKT